MALPQIPLYSGDTPNRTQPQAEFSNNADDWLNYQAPLPASYNALASAINVISKEIDDNAQLASASAASASGIANYKGLWSSLSGALNVPASVKHNGSFYFLLNNLANVALSEPSVTSDWQLIVNVGNIRKSLLDSPLFRFGVPNKIAHTLKGSLTVTRASTATYVGRLGVVRTAAIDEAREEKEGWLIEGASANFLLQSENFTTSWGTSGIVTANATIAPDGTLTADEFDGNDGNFYNLQQTVSSSGTVTFSVFVKQGTSNICNIRVGGTDVGPELSDRSVYEFNFDTENFTFKAGGTGSTSFKKLTYGWYRISLTVSAATVNAVFIYTKFSSPSTGTVYLWGAQLEALPLASSYIPTTTAPVTRLADQVSAQGDGNTPLLTDAYSIYAKVSSIGYFSFNALLNIGYSNNSGDKIATFFAENGSAFFSSGGDTNKFAQPSNIFEGGIDYCITSSGLEYRQYVDGNPDNGNPVSITSPPTDIPDKITIGSNYPTNSSFLFGHIKDFRIYDFELNADEVAFLGGGE